MAPFGAQAALFSCRVEISADCCGYLQGQSTNFDAVFAIRLDGEKFAGWHFFLVENAAEWNFSQYSHCYFFSVAKLKMDACSFWNQLAQLLLGNDALKLSRIKNNAVAVCSDELGTVVIGCDADGHWQLSIPPFLNWPAGLCVRSSKILFSIKQYHF